MNKAERRFAAKINCVDGHWMWTGAHLSEKAGGYGTFWFNGEVTTAHRASYQMFVGPLGPMDEVHHKCRIKLCVAPWDLEKTGHAGNMSYEHKRYCPRGHDTWITGRRDVYGGCVACQHEGSRSA